ncbi:MAG: VOC family protein [Pseudomonadales bacterium]
MPNALPHGIQRITTRIAYEDPAAAIAFLEAAFGFQERREKRLEGKGGSIIVAEVMIAESYLMIGPAGSHSLASPKTVGAATESLMIYIDSIDLHCSKAKLAGAEIISEPTDQYWGDRRYEAKDLEGHLWFFHERVREVSKEEIAAVEATFRAD